MKEAEANRLKLTPEFLELKFIEAIANNTKIFFGDKVKNMVSLSITPPHFLICSPDQLWYNTSIYLIVLD